MNHPSQEQLRQFGLGLLDADRLASIAAHVANCEQCCAALQGHKDDTLVALAREANPGNETADPTMIKDKSSDTPPTVQQPRDLPAGLQGNARYRILETIGAGGMGTVYKAEHRIMERIVALKVIKPEFVAHPTAVKRFRREVRAAARLSHENIVTAFDADQVGDLHFLAMEFVEGKSLGKVIADKGALPIHLACDFVAQAALGLQHAHENGMVHRDIKPHNLMLTPSGAVKILDFGLARFAAAELQSEAPQTHQLTGSNVILGTIDYLSPEQAVNSSKVDIRGDIYSLGCTFYHLLTGRPPFVEGSAVEKLMRQSTMEPEPVDKLRSGVPAGVAGVAAKMMAKRPEDRYQTPQEVYEALAPFCKRPADVTGQSGDSASTSSTAPRWRPRKLLFGALGLAVVIGIATWLIVWSSGYWQAPVASPVPKRVLFVVPKNGLYYPDYKPVRDILDKEGIQVVVASSATGKCQLDLAANQENKGKIVRIDRILDGSITAADFDAVIFAGSSTDEFTEKWSPATKHTARLLGEFAATDKKIITAICNGTHVLGKHALLKNRRVSKSPYIKEETYKKYAVGELVDKKVVTDGRIVTTGNFRAAQEFGRELAKRITSSRQQ